MPRAVLEVAGGHRIPGVPRPARWVRGGPHTLLAMRDEHLRALQRAPTSYLILGGVAAFVGGVLVGAWWKRRARRVSSAYQRGVDVLGASGLRGMDVILGAS